MAEIKILKPQVTEIAQTQTPASGSLAIPIGFATAQGDAISKAIKEVGKIYNDQKLEEDKAKAYEILPEIQKVISVAINKNSKTTDTNKGLKAYQEETSFDKFEPFLQNQNKRVRKTIKDWVLKNQPTNIASLVNKINTNHINNSKVQTDTYLNDLTIKMNDPDPNIALKAKTDYEAFWQNPVNTAYYDPKEFADLKKSKDNLRTEMYLRFQTKFNFREILKNGEAITKQYGKEKADKILASARKSLVSDVQKRKKYEEYEETANNQQQIANFTDILVRVQDAKTNKSNIDALAALPTLDNLYDIYRTGGINSFQYEALVNIVTDKEKPTDDFVYDMINSQLVYGEQIYNSDNFSNFVNSSPETLGKLNIQDIETFNKLADKFKKNRGAYQEFTTYGKQLKAQMGEAENFLLSRFNNNEIEKKVNAVEAAKVYNGYVSEGMMPQEAYVKTLEQFLNEDTLPKIDALPQPRSVNMSEYQESQKENFFKDAEKQIADAYKSGKIDSAQLLYDIEKLDNIKDVFGVWKKMGAADKAWSGSGSGGQSTKDIIKKKD